MRFSMMAKICLIGLILFSANVFAQSNNTGAAPKQMTDELAERDAALFEAVFVTCDFAELDAMVTEDFEFYHDRAGNNAKSGKEFVDSIRGGCERRKAGTDLRVKRELVAGSVSVYPLNNYGAIQMGEHRFYVVSDGKENLAEVAKFVHLWKKENGAWKLARVLSFDHKPAK
jgi:hypothetical protein